MFSRLNLKFEPVAVVQGIKSLVYLLTLVGIGSIGSVDLSTFTDANIAAAVAAIVVVVESVAGFVTRAKVFSPATVEVLEGAPVDPANPAL